MVRQSATKTEIEVFISHSSSDEEIAKRLITLLRSALNLPSHVIRCTSIDGFRLPAGIPANEKLRQEVHDSKVFIGLITPRSIVSVYVLFELGTRWGANRPMIPLLAGGADGHLLKGPLSALNSLSCGSAAQLHQLIEELAAELKINPDTPAAYQQCIDELVKESGPIEIAREQSAFSAGAHTRSQEKPTINWGCYQFQGTEGLFCTACYDLKGQKIRTTRLNSKFRMCPVCKAQLGS